MNPLKSKLVLSLFAFAVLSLGSAMTTRADIIVTQGNVPQNDENVLLNTGNTGNPLFGTTNQTQTSVRFTGTETLTAPANGQARIEAVDGTLNNLTIDTPGFTFTSLILNLDAEADGTVQFIVTEGNGMVNNFNFALGGSGSNFFTITAINGQNIRSVQFIATVGVSMGLDDAAQFRIGGIQRVPTAVPEPATMILLGTGLAGIAAKVRRRRKE